MDTGLREWAPKSNDSSDPSIADPLAALGLVRWAAAPSLEGGGRSAGLSSCGGNVGNRCQAMAGGMPVYRHKKKWVCWDTDNREEKRNDDGTRISKANCDGSWEKRKLYKTVQGGVETQTFDDEHDPVFELSRYTRAKPCGNCKAGGIDFCKVHQDRNTKTRRGRRTRKTTLTHDDTGYLRDGFGFGDADKLMTHDATGIDQADDRNNLNWDQFKNDSGLYKTHDDDPDDDDTLTLAGGDDGWIDGPNGPNDGRDANYQITNDLYIHNLPAGFGLVSIFEEGEENQPWGQWTPPGDTWRVPEDGDANDDANDDDEIGYTKFSLRIAAGAPANDNIFVTGTGNNNSLDNLIAWVKSKKIAVIQAQCAHLTGMGVDIFRYIVDDLRRSGVKCILLSVARTESALQFWIRCGFKIFVMDGDGADSDHPNPYVWMIRPMTGTGNSATRIVKANPDNDVFMAKRNPSGKRPLSIEADQRQDIEIDITGNDTTNTGQPKPFQMIELETPEEGDCPAWQWISSPNVKNWWNRVKSGNKTGGMCHVTNSQDVSWDGIKDEIEPMMGYENNRPQKGTLKLYLVNSVYGVSSRLTPIGTGGLRNYYLYKGDEPYKIGKMVNVNTGTYYNSNQNIEQQDDG